jgi:hypothetical protein
VGGAGRADMAGLNGILTVGVFALRGPIR